MTDDYLDGIMKRTAEQADSAIKKDAGVTKGIGDSPNVSAESLKTPQRGFKIQVSFQHPSVPVRKFDWVAFYEGEEERREYGYGSTPYMAVLDLINNYSPTLYAEAQKYKR